MGHTILKQANGKYCVFSSIVDDLVLANATKQNLLAFYLKRESQ